MAQQVISLPPKYQKAIASDPKLAARRQKYLPYVRAAAKKYNLPPAFLDMMLLQESRYTPGITGDNGQSFGMAQIYAPTAKQYGFDINKLLNDPQYAINAMAQVAADDRDIIGKDNFSNWGKARVAYQSGPGAIGDRSSWGPIAKDNYRAGVKFQALNDPGFSGDSTTLPSFQSKTPDAIVGTALNLGGVPNLSTGTPKVLGSSDDDPFSTAEGGNVQTQKVESLLSPKLPKSEHGRRFQATPYHDFYAATFGD